MNSPRVAMTMSTARFSIGVSPAVAADDVAERIGDAVHVVRRHAGEQWQRDDALPLGGGTGKVFGAGAEHVAVVAVFVQRDEMDAGPDPSRGELLNDFVAADA